MCAPPVVKICIFKSSHLNYIYVVYMYVSIYVGIAGSFFGIYEYICLLVACARYEQSAVSCEPRSDLNICIIFEQEFMVNGIEDHLFNEVRRCDCFYFLCFFFRFSLVIFFIRFFCMEFGCM